MTVKSIRQASRSLHGLVAGGTVPVTVADRYAGRLICTVTRSGHGFVKGETVIVPVKGGFTAVRPMSASGRKRARQKLNRAAKVQSAPESVSDAPTRPEPTKRELAAQERTKRAQRRLRALEGPTAEVDS